MNPLKNAIDDKNRGPKIGLDQKTWGPSAWAFLHAVTLNYPDAPDQSTQELYRRFFSVVGEVLPCKKCRNHYKTHVTTIPIRLQSRKDLVEWMVDIHNLANRATDKPVWTYRQAVEHFTCTFCKALTIPGYDDIVCPTPVAMYALVLAMCFAWQQRYMSTSSF